MGSRSHHTTQPYPPLVTDSEAVMCSPALTRALSVYGHYAVAMERAIQVAYKRQCETGHEREFRFKGKFYRKRAFYWPAEQRNKMLASLGKRKVRALFAEVADVSCPSLVCANFVMKARGLDEGDGVQCDWYSVNEAAIWNLNPTLQVAASSSLEFTPASTTLQRADAPTTGGGGSAGAANTPPPPANTPPLCAPARAEDFLSSGPLLNPDLRSELIEWMNSEGGESEQVKTDAPAAMLTRFGVQAVDDVRHTIGLLREVGVVTTPCAWNYAKWWLKHGPTKAKERTRRLTLAQAQDRFAIHIEKLNRTQATRDAVVTSLAVGRTAEVMISMSTEDRRDEFVNGLTPEWWRRYVHEVCKALKRSELEALGKDRSKDNVKLRDLVFEIFAGQGAGL